MSADHDERGGFRETLVAPVPEVSYAPPIPILGRVREVEGGQENVEEEEEEVERLCLHPRGLVKATPYGDTKTKTRSVFVFRAAIRNGN